MNKIVKFLVWEAVLLTGVYLAKTYGKQCETYWELFKEACKDEEPVTKPESKVNEEPKEPVVKKDEPTEVKPEIVEKVAEENTEETKPVAKPRTPRVKKVNPELTDIKKSVAEKKPRVPKAPKVQK